MTDPSAKRQIPLRRLATFPTVATETHEGRVAVVCRSRTVAKQWRKGVRAAGGRPCNLYCIVAGELPDDAPEQLRAMLPGMRIVDLRGAR